MLTGERERDVNAPGLQLACQEFASQTRHAPHAFGLRAKTTYVPNLGPTSLTHCKEPVLTSHNQEAQLCLKSS